MNNGTGLIFIRTSVSEIRAFLAENNRRFLHFREWLILNCDVLIHPRDLRFLHGVSFASNNFMSKVFILVKMQL